MIERLNYPTKYELMEVLSAVTNRSFLNTFAQKHGIFVTNVTLELLAEEISNLFLDNEDLEEIRREAYHVHSNHALSGFIVKSPDSNFSLKNTYQWIFEEANRKSGQKLTSLTKIPGETELYRASIEYNKKRPGRIEFLQDEISSFDFYIEKQPDNSWLVEIDSNRSTDLKELKELLNIGLKKEEVIEELEQKLLTTETSIQFFDKLSKAGLDHPWQFVDVKNLALKRGDDTEHSISDDDEELTKEADTEELTGIKEAILAGKNLREDLFVKQCVENGYRFNSMTYEYQNKETPYIIQVKAEFKGRPKVFEVSVVNFDEVGGSLGIIRKQAFLPKNENLSIRTIFWNNSKLVYDELVKRLAK